MQVPKEMLPWVFSEVDPGRYILDPDSLRSRVFRSKVLLLIAAETS